ncbi:nucleotidyltransferase family protein [Porticoccaceae bacterium]|nr:nucleotidyltransferase family protein [Porticoccaceae bacterium]
MRALLLAAGLGTRLRPITDNTPKCLVSISGRPLLEIWLDRLVDANIEPLLINTHYLADQVEKFVQGSQFQQKVQLVHESHLLGTAGTLIENLDFFKGEDGLLIHADNYCLADFDAFQVAHLNRPFGCLMTMMTFRTDDPSSCGIVEVDDRGVVIGFHEKVDNPPGNLANGAIYILSAELLEKIGADLNHITDFSTEVLHRFKGHIFSHEISDVFLDVGTPDRYEKANKLGDLGI